jgi:hypothetical protein
MAVPLILGAVQRAALAELRTRAAAAPIDMPDLLARLKTPEGKLAHRRHMTAQSVEIPADFLVTFSIETGHPIGTCRHMSMSVGRKGRRPHALAVWMIAKELGFVGELSDCMMWPEELEGHGAAINVVQSLAVIAAPTGTG